MHMTPTIVDDVPRRFNDIPKKVRKSTLFGSTKKYLGANNDRSIPWADYTSNINNEFGLGEHFQGIQRVGKRLILSGGIKTGDRRSQLVIIQMGSRSADQAWSLPQYKSGNYDYKNPALEDSILKVVDIDFQRWHAGGIQAMDDLLAVPVYGDPPGAEVRFFDVSGTPEPAREIESARFEVSIKANAVALTRRDDGFFILMIWDDERLHFYASQSDDITQGFKDADRSVHKDEVKGGFQPGGKGKSGMGTYQNVNFVRGPNDQIYLIGTRNKEKASPTIGGSDYADLYRVNWPNPDTDSPEIVLESHRQFYCYDSQCNFGAGAGVFAAGPSQLFLYGASHWLHGGNSRYNFNEYAHG